VNGTSQSDHSTAEQENPELGAAGDVEVEDDILPMVRIHSECFTGETIGSMRCDCGEQLDEAIRQIASPHRLPPSGSVSGKGQGNGKGRMVPGRGVVIYMRQEGRGIGLLEKIRAYNLQDLGHDTVAANLMLGHGADERKYDVAAEILRDLGLAGDDSAKRPASTGQGVVPGAQENGQLPEAEISAQQKGRTGIRLLTNNPEKVQGLAREGVYVQERVGMMPRDWKCMGQDDEPRGLSESRGGSEGEGEGESEEKDVDGEEVEYQEWRQRRAGVGMIGAGKAHGGELEKYLRTKVERMGHSELQ
jgi:GTP cyclohydrolase II